jgi:hypothetical protein
MGDERKGIIGDNMKRKERREVDYTYIFRFRNALVAEGRVMKQENTRLEIKQNEKTSRKQQHFPCGDVCMHRNNELLSVLQ